jgi:crotonobetainyl-CoA:carnitine CoA-transferase CaiB-like acyl-CoA transferase
MELLGRNCAIQCTQADVADATKLCIDASIYTAYGGAPRQPHLHDRGFWKEVEHPELGRSFVYPGEAAIHNGSPWRISRRAPLIGGHNAEILCEKLETVPKRSFAFWRKVV